MLMLGAHEGAYASAALFVALGRKLIDKEVISKEEMSGLWMRPEASRPEALQLLP